MDDALDLPETPQPRDTRAPAYRVLARKYRPQTFKDLRGQDALVRTLTNAITAGRVAQAFILTGVRGVGKTTTARIVARALNCIGPDGTGGMTTEPCGVCANCTAIAADRHVDVIEMDAASRTGVDDIREIIEGVRYTPVQARYKVYIIDEVHMLSRNAFNALLKTLEEPPPHVKFIFATTEIRKVPVTVLSRCQRFDLKRIEARVLHGLFTDVLAAETVVAEPDSVALIARAADGSARDGLSLLDQAIAMSATGDGPVRMETAVVQSMLGMTDRTRVIDLFAAMAKGDPTTALGILDDLIRGGGDPVAILNDLLDFTHLITRGKLLPDVLADTSLPEAERTTGKELAESLPMPVLSRAWQMLLKGVSEVQSAPRAETALEMVLIRLMHAAHLPPPGEIIAKLEKGGIPAAAGSQDAASPGRSATSARADAAPGLRPAPPAPGPAYAPTTAPAGGAPAAVSPAPLAPSAPPARAVNDTGFAATAGATDPAPDLDGPPPSPPLLDPEGEPPQLEPMPTGFRALVALFRDRGEPLVYDFLYRSSHLVAYQPGRIELRLGGNPPPDFVQKVMASLQDWTGHRWVVTVSSEPGDPPLRAQDRAEEEARLARARANPVVQAVMARFPDARILSVRNPLADAAALDSTGGAQQESGLDDGAAPGDGPTVPDPDELPDDADDLL